MELRWQTRTDKSLMGSEHEAPRAEDEQHLVEHECCELNAWGQWGICTLVRVRRAALVSWTFSKEGNRLVDNRFALSRRRMSSSAQSGASAKRLLLEETIVSPKKQSFLFQKTILFCGKKIMLVVSLSISWLVITSLNGMMPGRTTVDIVNRHIRVLPKLVPLQLL